ncbi:Pr6Pr family membrane protein [Hyphococcus lacteus]|uniref:Pr6Pr family membrane protein n=1 Tax=Hyphococcus lacteus TaxID=3143536 RepID=A0ABV3Z086_9PROT
MHRLFASAIALTALTALITQFFVSTETMGSPGLATVLWRMLGFFTVLTNILVVFTFARTAISGQRNGPVWIGGLTLWICAVGAVYHAVLATLWNPEGLAWWADQGLHTAVPILVLIWWLGFADKTGLRPYSALMWLVWPLVYCAYALTRGTVSGFYPYPFIDVATLGTGQVALNIAMLIIAFGLGGLGLVAIARLLSNRSV